MRVWAAAEFTEGQRQASLGGLPQWDLSDLYPGRDSAALARDLAELAGDAEAFRDRYEGRLAGLSGAELGTAVEAYERLQEKIGRIMSYASLVHAGDLADPEIGRFYQTMQERTNAISTALLFFTLELNRLEDAVLDAKLADPLLARYRPWLRDTRAFRPHQLVDDIEKLLLEKSVAGRAAQHHDQRIRSRWRHAAARPRRQDVALHRQHLVRHRRASDEVRRRSAHG